MERVGRRGAWFVRMQTRCGTHVKDNRGRRHRNPSIGGINTDHEATLPLQEHLGRPSGRLPKV
eukprot:5856584-Prymnesium_polylepis.1